MKQTNETGTQLTTTDSVNIKQPHTKTQAQQNNIIVNSINHTSIPHHSKHTLTTQKTQHSTRQTSLIAHP